MMAEEPGHIRRIDIRLSDRGWLTLDRAYEQAAALEGITYERFCARLLLDGLSLTARSGLVRRPGGKGTAA